MGGNFGIITIDMTDSETIIEMIKVAIDHIKARWQDYEWYFSENHMSYTLTCQVGSYIGQSSIQKYIMLNEVRIYNLPGYIIDQSVQLIENINSRILKDVKNGNISYNYEVDNGEIIDYKKEEILEEEKEDTNPFDMLDFS